MLVNIFFFTKQPPSAFTVKHFSDTVQYESYGFLEKNRDTVSKELVNVLRDSKLKLCHKLMNLEDNDSVKETKSNTSLGGRVVVSASKTLVSPLEQFFTLQIRFMLFIRCTSSSANDVQKLWLSQPTFMLNFVTVFRAQPVDANELVLSLDFYSLLFISNHRILRLFYLQLTCML